MANLPEEKEGGELDDRVSIQFGSDDVRYFEEYSVHIATLQVPAAFSVRLSAGSRLSREIIKKYPPKTRFGLRVGNYRQFTGETDGFEADGPSGSTSVTMPGRDLIARLIDADVDAERSFENETLEGIVKAALKEVGLESASLSVSSTASNKIRTGVNVRVIKEPVDASEVRTNPSGGGTRTVVTAKLGESWFDFVRRHIEKKGLFLWTDANGNFVLSRPNKDQAPIVHFVRGRGQPRNACNVEHARWKHITVRRFSEVEIHARNHGKKYGRNRTKGEYADAEMIALGYNRKRIYRDANVTTADEAAHYAARKIAEANRAGWTLQYTVSGHSAPAIGGGRAILAPDTLAKVDDDELGLHGNFYIESVEHRSPPRTTVVTLMRLQDLVFGAD